MEIITKKEKKLTRKQLKEMDYSEYLLTEHWQKVSEQARYRARYKCQVCGSTTDKLNVHHNSYIHRGEEDMYPEDLICLCKDCHEKFHLYDVMKNENFNLKKKNKELTEERDYIQMKFDLWRENISRDIKLGYRNLIKELPF